MQTFKQNEEDFEAGRWLERKPAKLYRGTAWHYSLIFQVKTTSKYNELSVEEIQRYCKVSPSGKLYCDNELEDGLLKSYWIGAVGTLNKVDDLTITFHDGNADNGCQYNGYHWHGAGYFRVDPQRDSRWGRKLDELSKASGETVFLSQAIEYVPALVQHIHEEPRQPLLVRGPVYQKYVDMEPVKGGKQRGEGPTTSTDSPDWDRTNLKQDATFFRIVNLAKLMAKYKCADLGVLTNKIRTQKKDWSKFLELKCASSWDTISKKAVELYCSEECVKTLDERMSEAPSWAGECETYYDRDRSRSVFNQWIEHNGFDRSSFVDQLFAVLSRRDKKKNTFMLQGATCAGKSWLLRSLSYFYPFYGEVHGMGNYNFAYQGCLDKALIFMEEPMLEPSTVDHAKQVLEGAQTLVNVKCKAPQLLQPTPVLITSNHDLWKWCPGERETLMTRMYLYHCKRAPWLKEIKKSLNPTFWWELYHNWSVEQEGLIEADAKEAEEALMRDNSPFECENASVENNRKFDKKQELIRKRFQNDKSGADGPSAKRRLVPADSDTENGDELADIQPLRFELQSPGHGDYDPAK
uniref:Nonstructural protein 1 n=1 Tax=Turdus pallidus parvoviridae sp. TaxID=2794526 RepID=A0A8A4XDC2_9VIRU|nr:MAG: nonstructural protein 1 [Turdus pallidus parvoviridae sp.]